MSLKCLIRIFLIVLIAVTGLRLSAVANQNLQLQLVWDHPQPETVKYYNIYLSDSQGVPTGKPYARITRLPTDRHGVSLKLPTNSIRYVTVTAVGDQGQESGFSNQLKIEINLITTDLQAP